MKTIILALSSVWVLQNHGKRISKYPAANAEVCTADIYATGADRAVHRVHRKDRHQQQPGRERDLPDRVVDRTGYSRTRLTALGQFDHLYHHRDRTANGLNPEKYINYLLTALPEHFSSDTKAAVDDLLPWSKGVQQLCLG